MEKDSYPDLTRRGKSRHDKEKDLEGVRWADLTQNRGSRIRGNLIKNSSGDKTKEDEMSGACGKHGEKRNAHRVLVGKP